MTGKYRLQGSTVHCDERSLLTYAEVAEFMRYGVRRKLRRRGHAAEFLEHLRQRGESDYGWNYARSSKIVGEQYVHVTAVRVGDGYRLHCLGARAEYTVARVCRIIERNADRKKDAELLRGTRRSKKERSRAARKKRERLATSQALRTGQPRTGKRRRKSPAPLSLANKEKLTPQFRRQHFFWDEAIRAVVHIFEVKGTWKHSSSQIVAAQLYASLEQNGERFAQFKRRGFSLRFDLADGIWRGDITRLTISATKDNVHPTYRRMREYFRELFLHPGGEAQARRRYRDDIARSLPKGTLLWKGVRFVA